MTLFRKAAALSLLVILTFALSISARAQNVAFAWGNGSAPYYDLIPSAVPNTSNAVAISSGGSHYHVVKADGTVWSWGYNANGELGNGTTTDSMVPVQASGLTGVVNIASGFNHTLAIKNDGTVWAWGSNVYGQLGSVAGGAKSTVPVQVPGLTGIVAVAGGRWHSLAVKNDGTVWAWGYNKTGELGDGTTTNSISPIQVPGVTGAVKVSAGAYHSLALKADGTLMGWGENYNGQIGPPGAPYYYKSAYAVDGISNVTSIRSGYYHNLALVNDGTVLSWGYGPLGHGSGDIHVTGLSGVTAIGTGAGSSFAVLSDGTVRGWGALVGDGTSTLRDTPTKLLGVTGAIDVAFGVLLKDRSTSAIMQNQADSNIALLTLRGASFLSSIVVTPKLPAGWNVVSRADYNGDGEYDLLVQNPTTRSLSILYLNGNTVLSSVPITPALPANTLVMTAGRFDSGTQGLQLVTQNMSTQEIAVVAVEGTQITGTYPFYTKLAPGWQVVGSANLTGDWRSELVVQNTSTRQISFLTTYYRQITGSIPLKPTLPGGWVVRGVGDFNLDGYPDLMAQNTTTRQVAVLTVVNMQITSSYSVNPAPAAGWVVVGPK